MSHDKWKISYFILAITSSVTCFILDEKNPFSLFRKWDAGLNGTLELEFKTDQADGLILYTEAGRSDFFELKLVNGTLRLRYNLGGGAQIITLGKGLNDGTWHKVQVTRREEYTTLSLDGKSQTKTSRGKEFLFGNYATNSEVFVGGLPPEYISKLPNLALPTVIFEPKFRGAIRNLVYSDAPGQPPRRQEVRASRDVKISDACERRDPCQHGGVCISTDKGPSCECRDGDYEGAFCERDKAPSEATFRGTEFLSYDLTQTGGEPIVSNQDAISIYFKTRQPNGLLFYTGHGSDYLNLAVRDGGVSLTMGLANGKQEMHIKPSKVRFDDHQWHKVTVYRRVQEISSITSFCRVSAIVDDVYAEHSHVAGQFSMLASSKAHVGGSLNARALPGARVHNNFIGCLKKVEFSADTLRLNLIDLARTGSKLIAVTGRLEYSCTAADTADPVTFTTRESHLVLPKWDAVKTGTLSFKFRTNEPNGLIALNTGVKPPRSDLFAVELLNGHIYVHMDLGSGGVRVRASRRRVDDGQWHEFLLRRTGRDGRVTIDGASAEFKTPGESNQLELDVPFYLGGLGPEHTPSNTPSALWTAALRQGFVGCIRDLVMNGKPFDMTSYARQQDSASVKPSCHVLPPQCLNSPCQNGGVCSEGWNRPLCDCSSTNFAGPTCGRESPTIMLNGSQHLSVNLGSDHLTQTEELLLRFKTSKLNCLLLLTSSENSADRIELSVTSGRVRASVRLGDREKNLLAGQNVNDNNWHTIRFSRRASNLKLQVDTAVPVRAETILGKGSALEISTLHLGGLFHAEEEIQMTSTIPYFIGMMQHFIFNGHKYIELAKTVGLTESNSIYDSSNIKFTGVFVDNGKEYIYKPVTFRTKHTFVGLPLLKAYASTYIDFYFKTIEPDGILVYNGGKKQDFIAIELVNGHVHCVFNLGDGVVTMRDNLKETTNDNKWHSVSIRRPTPKIYSLTVDGNLTTHATSANLMLELDGVMYVGGVAKDLYSTLPVGIVSRQGFEGCMASLDLPGESPSLIDDAVVPSSSLKSGCEGSARCTMNTCLHRGTCKQKWNTFICDCEMTSYSGPTCNEESVTYEFGPGRGQILYNIPESRIADTENDNIALGFATNKAEAVLLRIESSTTQDYIEMELVQGNLFAIYDVGSGVHPLADMTIRVDDGGYHVVRFIRNGSHSSLQIDNFAVQIRHSQGHQSTIFNSLARILIGGAWGKGKPFSGVVSGISVNGVRVLDKAAEEDSGVVIRGDARRALSPLDNGSEQNRMQQTPASGYPGVGVMDELIYSGAGSGCRDDDEDECVIPEGGPGDDLITPVYVPSTRKTPTGRDKGKIGLHSRDKIIDKACDDEDCFEGSGIDPVTESTHSTTNADTATTGHRSTSSVTDPITSSHGTTIKLPPTTHRETWRTEGRPYDTSSTKEIDKSSTIPDWTTTRRDHKTSPEYTRTTIEQATIPTFRTDHEDRHPEPDDYEPPFTEYRTRAPKKLDPFENYETTTMMRDKDRVSSAKSEYFAFIVGIVATVLIAIILVVIIVLKFIVFRMDPSYKVEDDKAYQQGVNAALLANQQSGYASGSSTGPRNLQPLPLHRNGHPSPLGQGPSKKRDSKDVKEWYV